eukprot:TRINITY_DN25091_c0_g1_i2.p1 TRINITY_DN25091_c0_g1~~TRINITY_DN25091_c0_g1_i2.p1  ORF type:complete len:1565 (+),score=406.26 TRINITY_DN25091_c0_g1_i2:452-4696(+)
MEPGELQEVMAFDAVQQNEVYWPDEAEYSALPPNRQRSLWQQKRMVVFSTNVAETSVTVPGVRLVVDTGLAKEATYDVRRRATVIDAVHISKASADQRRGRVGRIESGRCVRLYADSDITRRDTTPEIQRSSLDLLCLRLCNLGLDPRPDAAVPFNYLPQSKPDASHIGTSLAMLQEFGCLEQTAVTEKGRFFFGLDFDPRLAELVVQMGQRGNLRLGVTVVSILQARPIYYMGGGDDVKRQQAHRARAERAGDSDLLLACGLYTEWENLPPGSRGAFASERMLNNKSLKTVSATFWKLAKSFASAEGRMVLGSIPAPTDKSNALAEALLVCDRNRLCEVRVPSLPQEGVRLVSDDALCVMDKLSVLRTPGHEPAAFCIAQDIRVTDKGAFVGQLHPVTHDQIQRVAGSVLPRLCYFESLMEVAPVGRYIGEHALKRGVHPWISDGPLPMAVPVRAVQAAQATIFGPRDLKSLCNIVVSALVERVTEKLLMERCEAVLQEGSVHVTIGSGLKIHELSFGNRGVTAVVLRQCKETRFSYANEVDAFIAKRKLDDGLLRWCKSRSTGTRGIALWKLLYKSQEHAVSAARALDGLVGVAQEENTSRGTLSCGAPLSFATEFMQTQDGQSCSFNLAFDQLHPDWAEVLQQKCVALQLRHNFRLYEGKGNICPQPQRLCLWEADKKAFGALLAVIPEALNSFQAVICNRHTKEVNPTVTATIIAPSPRIAKLIPGDRKQYNAVVSRHRFTHETIEEGMQQALRQVLVSYPSVTAELKQINAHSPLVRRLIVTGCDTDTVVSAGRTFDRLTAPNTLDLRQNSDLRALLQDLLDTKTEAGSSKLHAEALRCGVKLDDRLCTWWDSITVQGTDYDFGRFLSRIGELYDNFTKRFKRFPLEPRQLSLMREPRGQQWMRDVLSEIQGLRLRLNVSNQELVMHTASAEGMDGLVCRLRHFLKAPAGVAESSCTKCGASRTIRLVHCGHGVCLDCLPMLRQGRCPVAGCRGVVCAPDLRDGKGALTDVVSAVVLRFLAEHSDPTVGLCRRPVGQGVCNTMLNKQLGFQRCWGCCEEVCPSCDSTDPRHKDRSCANLQAYIESITKCPGCQGDVIKRHDAEMCQTCGLIFCHKCDSVQCAPHVGLTCDEYRHYVATHIACPACNVDVLRGQPVQECDSCRATFCQTCLVVDCPLHRGRSCGEYVQYLSSLVLCPACHVKVERGQPVQECGACKVLFCQTCRSVDCGLHIGVSCDEYRRKLAEDPLRAVWEAAKEFVKNAFPPRLGPYTFHSCVDPAYEATPSFTKFRNARGGNVLPTTGRFGWHGTRTREALVAICRDGWDPSRRAGQACGPGEYFGHTAETSMGYAGATNMLIVAFILHGPHLNDTAHLVVNNPLDSHKAYVLPVGVVVFGNAQPPVFDRKKKRQL